MAVLIVLLASVISLAMNRTEIMKKKNIKQET